MISLQRSMHSSQMYTPGPAMSFLTCFCDFPQNEHFSRSPPSPNFATRAPGPLVPPYVPVPAISTDRGRRDLSRFARRDDLVNDTIGLRLFCGHDEVAIR